MVHGGNQSKGHQKRKERKKEKKKTRFITFYYCKKRRIRKTLSTCMNSYKDNYDLLGWGKGGQDRNAWSTGFMDKPAGEKWIMGIASIFLTMDMNLAKDTPPKYGLAGYGIWDCFVFFRVIDNVEYGVTVFLFSVLGICYSTVGLWCSLDRFAAGCK